MLISWFTLTTAQPILPPVTLHTICCLNANFVYPLMSFYRHLQANQQTNYSNYVEKWQREMREAYEIASRFSSKRKAQDVKRHEK